MKLKTLLMLLAIALFAGSCSDDPTGPSKSDNSMSDYIIISNIHYSNDLKDTDVYTFDSDGGNPKLLFEKQALTGRGNKKTSFIFDLDYYENNKPMQKIYAYDFASQEIGFTYSGDDPVNFDLIPNSDKYLKYEMKNYTLKNYIVNDMGETVAYLEGADNAEYVVCSNNGKYILVYQGLYEETSVYDLEGNKIPLPGSQNMVYSYTWHPKEDKLIFAAIVNDEKSVTRTYNFESKESEELLSSSSDITRSLSFSPDGAKVAFMDRNWNVKVMDPDGKNIKTLKMNNYPSYIDIYDTTPVWSPDSKNIVVRDFSNGVTSADYDVEMINIETGTITPFLPDFERKALYRWVKVK